MAAVALIVPLAWKPPYATGAYLEKAKKKKKNYERSSLGSSAEMNLSSIHEDTGLIPLASFSGLRI